MFSILGFVFGLLFSVSKFTLKNAIRAGLYGLAGYAVYELIVGYAHGRRGLPVPAPAAAEPEPEPAPATADRSPLTGSEKRGRTVQVQDAGGVAHRTRVGRGVIRR